MAATPRPPTTSRPGTRRPISPTSGRSRDDSERTTAVYLSIAIHAVVVLILVAGHLTRPETPSFVLHQEVDILSITEFDPLWRGRQLTREPLDSSAGGIPERVARASPDPAPNEPASGWGEAMHQVSGSVPPAPSSSRPADRPVDGTAPVTLAPPANPGRHLLTDPANPGRHLVTNSADPGRHWLDSARDDTDATITMALRAPGAQPSPTPPQSADEARARDGSAIVAALVNSDIDRAKFIGTAPAILSAPVPETAKRVPIDDAPTDALIEVPAEPPANAQVRALENRTGVIRNPVADRPGSASEGETASPIRPTVAKTPASEVATAPNRAGEVASPNRHHAPAATLEGISPTGAHPAKATEAEPGNAQFESKPPAAAREGRTPPGLAAASPGPGAPPPAPPPAPKDALEEAPAAAIELSFPATGAPPPIRPAGPDTVAGTDAASIPAKIDTERLLDGLLPFARPPPRRTSPAETAVAAIKRQGLASRTPGADVGRIARTLAAVECGRLSGDLDEATGSLRLEGHVPSLGERARVYGELVRLPGVSEIRDGGVVILPRPHCRVLDTLRRAVLTASTAHRASPRMLVRPTQAGIKRFVHGERIVLRLTTPAWPAYLTVDFYDLKGRVTHLIPNPGVPPHRFEAGQMLSIGDGGSGVELRAAAPYGANILVAIGTSAPLFDRARPQIESSESYLAALHKVIAAKRGAGTPLTEEYVYVFVITEDRARRSAETGRPNSE